MVGTAGVAGTVAGLGGLGGQSLVVLPHQILVGDAVVHVRPRGHLVQPDGALAVEGGVDAQIAKVCIQVSYLKHSSQPSK